MPARSALPPNDFDFLDYAARNLSDAYRLVQMALEDPIRAQDVVHETIMSAWLSADGRSESDHDSAFRRRLDAATAVAIRRASQETAEVPADPLEREIAGLSPELQVELARSFGPWGPDAAETGGATLGEPGSAALSTLAERLGSDEPLGARAADLETRLRTLYEARDPGAPAPLALRERLRDDQDRAIAAEAEIASNIARRRRVPAWGFGVNVFLGLTVLTLVVALASVVSVRASVVASADPTADPATPLTIADISVVQQGIDGAAVHVGATQRTLMASFAAAPLWHTSDRQCLADVVGTINWDGTASWVGQRAGHIDALAGDPSSSSAYVAGLGPYCELGRYASSDGGASWSAGALPGNATASPSWLAFDPAHAGTLLAYSTGTLLLSRDSGSKWTSLQSSVEPLAFDSTGRLVGWTSGKLHQSLDDGATWQETGPGPVGRPVAAGATSGGALLGTTGELWWYPVTAAPSLLGAGSVFSIASLGDDAVVVGADTSGRPWLGTVNATDAGMSLAQLPPELADLRVSGGDVAVNDSGAVVAFSGATSAIALVTFAY